MINDKILIQNGYTLALGGWGYMAQEIKPEFLQFTIQEFITLEECNKTLTDLLQKYPEESEMPLGEGKLCTLPPKSTSACHGDSGSGLIMAPVSFLIFLLTLKGITVGS